MATKFTACVKFGTSYSYSSSDVRFGPCDSRDMAAELANTWMALQPKALPGVTPDPTNHIRGVEIITEEFGNEHDDHTFASSLALDGDK